MRLLTLFSFALALIYVSDAIVASRVAARAEGSAISPADSSALQAHEDALAQVRRLDRSTRDADARPSRLAAAEHLRRGNIYLANRAFAEARSHYQAILAEYPQDGGVPEALFGLGRSYFQERRYLEALPFYERLARDFPQTKDGREGLNASAAALLRAGRPSEAVARYRQYIDRYPLGERIETAYLNVIDGLREAGQPEEAILWISRTRTKFPGTITDTNALFARLRLEVAAGDWAHAIQTCDELQRKALPPGAATSFPEVAYLRAYSLERSGRTEEAINAYLAIPDGSESYYGAQATARLLALTGGARRASVTARLNLVEAEVASNAALYPAPYREAIIRACAARNLDPRFLLAIMRQESRFNPRARSAAAARGLLQLTIDTATKYATRAGLNNLYEEELYRPETSIVVGAEYLGELARMFPGSTEAVAASYNGGEDNVARWVRRAKQPDPGILTSEIGFAETKNYVFKVMANYRAYRQLYTRELQPQRNGSQ